MGRVCSPWICLSSHYWCNSYRRLRWTFRSHIVFYQHATTSKYSLHSPISPFFESLHAAVYPALYYGVCISTAKARAVWRICIEMWINILSLSLWSKVWLLSRNLEITTILKNSLYYWNLSILLTMNCNLSLDLAFGLQ